MRLRSLAIFPLLYAAAFAAVAFWLDGGDSLGPFVTGQRILVRILAVVGCFAAVSVFQRGDHLRRAWLFLAWGTIAILLRDVLRLLPAFDPASSAPAAEVFVRGLFIFSNLGLLAGIWLLARAWKMAAISLPGGRLGVFIVALLTAVLALLVAGPAALTSAKELWQGDLNALIEVVSPVVDIVTLCLIAPLLLTAISLRGGSFSWPWGLITASQLSWLLYDGAVTLAPVLVPAGFPLGDVFRGLAENFLFGAGLAQLWVVQQVRRPVE